MTEPTQEVACDGCGTIALRDQARGWIVWRVGPNILATFCPVCRKDTRTELVHDPEAKP